MTTLARKEIAILDVNGRPISGAQVTVHKETSGFPLATLWTDRAGTVSAGNPIYSDGYGVAAFHALGGPYKIDVVAPGYTQTSRYVPVGTAQELDSDAFILAGGAPKTVGTRAELKGLSTNVYNAAYLRELGREGMFLFTAGDYAARVTADTSEGMYLKADDTATSAGAWVRVEAWTGLVNIVTSGSVTIGVSDGLLLLNKGSPGATVVTLPPVSYRNNLALKFADIGGNAGDVTFTPNGSEKIMGLSSMTAVSNGQGAGMAASGTLYPSTDINGWYLA